MFKWEWLDQAEAWGITISAQERILFNRYLEAVYRFNRQTNLTRVPEEEAVGRHLLDSLVILSVYQPPTGAKVLDVGTGAGLPGIPLKVVRPDLQITFLDSHGKSLGFVRRACSQLGFTGVEFALTRAEEWAHFEESREGFDCVTARAVAAMPILAEIMIPFVTVGGTAVALKSDTEEGEIWAAEAASQMLGAKQTMQPVSFEMEAGGVTRLVVLMTKTESTPERYPRRWARMNRDPLGGKS